MSWRFAFVLLASCGVSAVSAQQTPKPTTTIEKFSYAMGYRMAQDLIRQNMTIVDPASLASGVDDALQGKAFGVPAKQMPEIVAAYQQLVMEKGAEQAGQNKLAGEAFLQANQEKEGVQVFENGIQYRIQTPGTGAIPKVDDTVKVHYVGRLLDGQVFDSSRQRGKPAEFNLGGVIKGWTQTLAKMPTGSRWIVWIPSELAYGERGAGGKIGPNMTLEFDIELLEVLKKE